MAYKLRSNIPESQEESTLGYLGRTGARTLARAGESILGLPGDIAKGTQDLVSYGASKLTGKPTKIPFFDPKTIDLINQGIGKVTGQPNTLRETLLPTSEDIRSGTKKLTGEYLEPQTSNEESYDQIISDAAALFMPFKSKVPFTKTIPGVLGKAKEIGSAFTGALSKSAIGNVAQWAAEKVSDSPWVGAGAKLGAMAFASTIGSRKELTKLKTQSYDDAYTKIPKNTQFDFRPEQKKLDTIIKDISQSARKDKKYLLETLKPFDDKLANAGRGSVKSMIDLKQDWNDHARTSGLDIKTRKTINEAVSTVNQGIERYGITNPEFYKPYKIGEELHSALKSTNYIQKFIGQHPKLKNIADNKLVQHMFWAGTYHSLPQLISAKAATIGAGTLGVYEAARTYQLLTTSPVALRYYKDVINASLKNDVKSTARSLSKLNKAADDFESKHPEVNKQPKGKYRLRD